MKTTIIIITALLLVSAICTAYYIETCDIVECDICGTWIITKHPVDIVSGVDIGFSDNIVTYQSNCFSLGNYSLADGFNIPNVKVCPSCKKKYLEPIETLITDMVADAKKAEEKTRKANQMKHRQEKIDELERQVERLKRGVQ